MNVLLCQLDGSIPNLALMRISDHHRSRGNTVMIKHGRQRRRQSFWQREETERGRE
jgi:hypothetical protein